VFTRQKISEWLCGVMWYFFWQELYFLEINKQGRSALFLAHAECRNLRRLVAELACLHVLRDKLTISSIEPIAVKCDNPATIYTGKNSVMKE